MQLHILNRLFQKMRIFFSNCCLFRLIFFIVFTCLSTLLFLFSNFVLAGNVRPPVVALSDSIKSGASFDGLDEFGLHDHTTDQNFSLSSDLFGVSGPLSFSVTWSDQYDLSLNMNYVRLLNARNAYAIEASLGVKSNRLNLTVGHAFSSKNRLKLTVERLAQKQSFDFDSGSIDHWVSQYAGGAEFQHLLGVGVLNNIAAGGYYARALDKTLDPVLYDSAGTPWINFRHIAGASSKGFNTSIGIRPWKTGIITLVGYYDFVHYHHLYENVSASDSSQLGFGLSLNQYLSSSMQGNLSFVYRATYKTIQAGIQWLHNIFHQTRSLAFSLSGSHSSSDNVSHDNSVTVGMQYYFAPVQNVYRIPEFHLSALKNWTSQPAVRMDQVLAAADQMSEQVTISWNGKQMLAFSTTRSNGQVNEQIHREDATINIADGDLEYFLTVKEMPSSANALLSSASAEDEEPMIDHDVTKYNLKVGTKYQAILRAHDNKTGVSRQYESFFQIDAGSIVWPEEKLKPKFVYMDRDDDMSVHGKISAMPPISTISDNVILHVNISAHESDEPPIYNEQPSSDEVQNGIEVHGLTPWAQYDFSIDPTDEYGTPGEKRTGTFIAEPVNGEMSWSVDKISFDATDSSDISKGGKISWSKATPSNASDTVTYKVTVDFGAERIVQLTTNNFLDIESGKLEPSKTYTVTLSAHDDGDNDITLNELTFTTDADAKMIGLIDNVTFNWVDASHPSKGGTFTWDGPQPSTESDQIHYHLVATQGEHSKECSDVETTTCTIDNSDLGLLPNTRLTSLFIKATDERDLPVTYDDASIVTPKGVMTGDISNVVFTENTTNKPSDGGTLTWDKPTPSISEASITSTCVVSQGNNKFTVSDSGAYCEIPADKNLLSYTEYTVSITEENDYDETKTASNLSFRTPQGTLTWDTLTTSNTSLDYQSVSFLAATPSNTGEEVKYNITVQGEDGTDVRGKVTTSNSKPSHTFINNTFVPDVDYIVTIQATDTSDHNSVTRNVTVNYALTWDNTTTATWDRTRNYDFRNPEKSYDRYTFYITPEANTDPSLGLIQYQYKITYEKNNNSTTLVDWTNLNKGKNTISKNDVPYKAIVTLQVKASLADAKYADLSTSTVTFTT